MFIPNAAIYFIIFPKKLFVPNEMTDLIFFFPIEEFVEWEWKRQLELCIPSSFMFLLLFFSAIM